MGIEDLLNDENLKPKATDEVIEQETSANVEASQQVIPNSDAEIETAKPLELNDDVVLNYIREQKKREVTSFDDLFKEKEVIKEVNPYADIQDDYITDYLKFRKETGLGRKEFDFVQQDFSNKSPLDWAIEKVRKDNGLELSKDQIINYLEKKLQVDLSSDELDSSDAIELNTFVKDYKADVIGLQEKYKTTERKEAPKAEMVTLSNGEQMEKAKYVELQNQRNQYINNLKEGVSSATSFDVEYEFDNNGEKQVSKFTYDYSEKDKHSMLSNASDIDAFISNKFRTEKGFDYKGLASFIDKAENFNKYLALAVNQARAEALESKIAQDNNENFNKSPKQYTQSGKSTAKSILDLVPTT